MEFDPESGGMKCRFCGHAEALAPPATTEPEWHPFDETLGDADGAPAQPLSTAALEVSCAGCGSVVAFEPPEVAGTCPFCGATIVAEPKAADPLVAPDAVLPAKVPGNAAQAGVRRWLATRWFAPNALQRMARQDGISGVYLPFWDYAADTESHYAGGRGEHYWDTEYYTETDSDGNTVQRSRQIQRTRWYPISGSVSLRFDDLLVAGTRSVAAPRLNGLEPWDIEALRPYEPAYLAGFKAQRYQIELPEGFEKAKERMAPAIERDVREDIGGDEQRIDHIGTEYANVAFRHLLLPVWIGAYRFQGKVYQVAVNARTGEVQGERPYSVWKIVLLAAVILLVVWLLIALGSAHR
jgi:hypothetical protein